MHRPIILASAALLIACTACAGHRVSSRESTATSEPAGPGMSPQDQVGEVSSNYDLNRDGKPDVWKHSKKGADGSEVLLRKEKDLNGDGKVDVQEFFSDGSTVSKQIFDMDFDGRPDVTLFFEKGQLVRKEYGFAFGNRPDTWNFYEKNRLVRRERDTDGDGKIDYWEYWEGEEIDRIGVDLDGDGKVDKWEMRKPAEGQSHAERAPAEPKETGKK